MHLLARLSRKPERLVISVTHSLRHLSLCDSVLVLFGGRVAYHGLPEHMYHYFGVEKHEDLFSILGSRPAKGWHTSWQKHRPTAGRARLLAASAAPPPETSRGRPRSTPSQLPSCTRPALLTQWWILTAAPLAPFLRDRGQLGLHLALLFGFPFLVVIFALDGLPQMKSLAAPVGSNVLQQVVSELRSKPSASTPAASSPG